MTQPSIAHPDDGSVLVEWVFDGFRFGLSFEPDPSESSWFFVTNHEHGDLMESGKLPKHLKWRERVEYADIREYFCRPCHDVDEFYPPDEEA